MDSEHPKHLAELLRRAQAGDHSALQQLCRELESYVRGFFLKKFRDKTIVDDLCQETFIHLLNSLPQIRDKMKLKSFVAKVTFHVMQDHFRQKYRKGEESLKEDYQSGEAVETQLKVDSDDGRTDDNILDSMDLSKALNQLPDKSREIILLKSQGYNYEEISNQLDLSVSGVKMQIKRTLEQLRFSLLDVTFWPFLTTILMKDIS